MESNKFFLFFVLTILLIGTSCSQIKVQTPSSRYISPEATGKPLSGDLEIQQQVGTQGTIKFSSTNLDESMSLRNDVSPIGLGINLGLLDKIDFFSYAYTNAATMYGIKLQLIGESRINAKKDNFSLALTAGYGDTESSKDTSDIFTTSSTSAKINHQLSDFSVIAGFRTHEDVLVYGSVHTTFHRLNLKVESDTASLDGKNVKFSTDNLGVALGVIRYFDTYSIKLETSAQQTNWTNSDKTTYGFVGLTVGKYW